MSSVGVCTVALIVIVVCGMSTKCQLCLADSKFKFEIVGDRFYRTFEIKRRPSLNTVT